MKIKRYIIYPILLLIYFIAMAAWFGPELVKAGQTWRLYLVGAIEGVILVLLYIFLRKKEYYHNKRNSGNN